MKSFEALESIGSNLEIGYMQDQEKRLLMRQLGGEEGIIINIETFRVW